MNETPTFNIYEPPDPKTGQVVKVFVELDPGDNSNFQTHPVMRVCFDSVNNNWTIERQTFTTIATKLDKDSAIKEAIKQLTADWAAQ